MDFNGEVGKLLVAIALGTAVGLEREISEKPAGLKTNVLICLGSALFTILSLRFLGAGQDPGRVAAQIVTGIGFLGAGAILREGEQVTGLTTAATIWVVAAVGMGVGMGHYGLAALATLGTLVVQFGFTYLDAVADRLQQRQRLRLLTGSDEQALAVVRRTIEAQGATVLQSKVMKKERLYQSEWWIGGSSEVREKAVGALLKAAEVIEVAY